jgi:hypothetical protein
VGKGQSAHENCNGVVRTSSRTYDTIELCIHARGEFTMLISSLALIFSLVIEPPAPTTSYDGYLGVRVLPETIARAEEVSHLATHLLDDRPNPFSMNVVIAPQVMPALDLMGVEYEVWEPNLGTRVSEERRRIHAWRERHPMGSRSFYSAWFDEFQDADSYQAYIDELVALEPDIVTKIEVGRSVNNEAIYALKIGGARANAGISIIGLQHAREWIGGAIAMYTADTLIRNYSTDAKIKNLVDSLEFHVIPLMNPDGYRYTSSDDRMWRKNLGEGGQGIDLNRNWDFEFGGAGTSSNPSSDNYCGQAAFSEPESKAVSDYILANQAMIKGQIDFHCQAQYVVYPPGCIDEPPPMAEVHRSLAEQMADSVTAKHSVDYTVIRGYDWYPACGASDDWGANKAGLLGFTIEVRGDNFSLPAEEILPTCEENFEAVLDLADWMIENYPPEDESDTGSSGEESSTDPASGTESEDPATDDPESSETPSTTSTTPEESISSDDPSDPNSEETGTDTATTLSEENSDDTLSADSSDASDLDDAQDGCTCQSPASSGGRWSFATIAVFLGFTRARRRRFAGVRSGQ